MHPATSEERASFGEIGRTIFSDLCTGRVAYQWAVARRRKDGAPFADQDEGFSKAVDHVVRAAHAVIVRDSNEQHVPSTLHITLAVPVLALATRLFTYDTVTQELAASERAMLIRGFDIGGKTGVRILDLVTESEIQPFAIQYKAAAASLCDRLAQSGDLLHATSARQVELNARRALRDA